MEGRASTFRTVLADFQSKLKNAAFVAIDTEFTGTDIASDPNAFEGSAALRLDKVCNTCDSTCLIRLGLTLVGTPNDNGCIACSTYSLFAFPYVGPEFLGRDSDYFFCEMSALRASAHRHVDFNTWIREGIPFMNRSEEKHFMKLQPKTDKQVLEDKLGLLVFWRELCSARIPFVVHCPLDLFLLLASFEQRPLPRHDLRALSALIRQCTPQVYDTAHLRSKFEDSKELDLWSCFVEARTKHMEVKGPGRQTVEFALQGNTAVRYSKLLSSSKPSEIIGAEAGFGSLVTAQLFVYLRANAPQLVKQGGNKLFLYQKAHLDVDRYALEGEVGTSMFDLSRVTLLVAALDPQEGHDAPGQISAANHTVKRLDSKHVLVVLGASGKTAIQTAEDLAAQVHGVTNWMAFEEWRALQATEAAKERGSAAHAWTHFEAFLLSSITPQAGRMSRWLALGGASLALVLVARSKALASTTSTSLRV